MRTTLHASLAFALLLADLSQSARAQTDLMTNAKMATVFVAKFNEEGNFIGWGSGFFVDQGVVVTNKHVVEGGRYFKVFPVESDDTVNLDCGRELGLSDVKVNLDDDAGYMRAFLDCPHGVLQFADDDPPQGESVTVLGYPARGTLTESLRLATSTGSVTGRTSDGWLTTDAYLHFGNSGGPVISRGKVVGVAVAKTTDASGKFVTGYFVPSSVILKGLLYANTSTFGYTPQDQQNNPAYPKSLPYGEEGNPFDPPRQNPNASAGECRQSLGEGGEDTGYGGCRCKDVYHKNPAGNACVPGPEPSLQAPSASVSSPSSESSTPPQSSSLEQPRRVQTPFQLRTCARVMRWFSGNQKILDRVDARLEKRFGFRCGSVA